MGTKSVSLRMDLSMFVAEWKALVQRKRLQIWTRGWNGSWSKFLHEAKWKGHRA